MSPENYEVPRLGNWHKNRDLDLQRILDKQERIYHNGETINCEKWPENIAI